MAHGILIDFLNILLLFLNTVFEAEKALRNDVDSMPKRLCVKTANPRKHGFLLGKITIFKVSRFSAVRDTSPFLLKKSY